MKSVSFSSLPGYLQQRPFAAVYFSSPSCGPCRNMPPLLSKLERATNALVVKVDINESPSLVQRYGLTSVPTVGFYEYGREVDRVVGAPTSAQKLISVARRHL